MDTWTLDLKGLKKNITKRGRTVTISTNRYGYYIIITDKRRRKVAVNLSSISVPYRPDNQTSKKDFSHIENVRNHAGYYMAEYGETACLDPDLDSEDEEAGLIAVFFRGIMDAGCTYRGKRKGKVCNCWRCKIAKEARAIVGVKNANSLLG